MLDDVQQGHDLCGRHDRILGDRLCRAEPHEIQKHDRAAGGYRTEFCGRPLISEVAGENLQISILTTAISIVVSRPDFKFQLELLLARKIRRATDASSFPPLFILGACPSFLHRHPCTPPAGYSSYIFACVTLTTPRFSGQIHLLVGTPLMPVDPRSRESATNRTSSP